IPSESDSIPLKMEDFRKYNRLSIYFSLGRAAAAVCLAAPVELQWRMPALTREKKITFGEMRSSGVRGLLIYCADYHCSHSIAISGDQWPDNVRLSDLEPLFVCQSEPHRITKCFRAIAT